MVQEKVLAKINDKKLKVYVVWAPVLRSDNRKKAVGAMKLLSDKRTVHFWDPKKKLGLRYGKIVELPKNRKLAWDIYFAFDGKSRWKRDPPKPNDWMHQLGRDKRRLDGDKLRDSIRKLLKKGN